jgi:gas vesicle protein
MAYGGKAGETRTSKVSRDESAFSLGALATGIAIGLVVGAGVALLYSPASGDETRRALRKRMRRMRRRGRNAWDDLGAELRQARRRWSRDRERLRPHAPAQDA